MDVACRPLQGSSLGVTRASLLGSIIILGTLMLLGAVSLTYFSGAYLYFTLLMAEQLDTVPKWDYTVVVLGRGY